jgi:hypothetical protein
MKVPVAHITIQTLRLKFMEKPTSIQNNLFYVQFTIGKWTTRSKGITPLPTELIEWFDHEVRGQVGINALQVDSLIVEIIDEHPETLERTVVAKGITSIEGIIGANIRRQILIEIQLTKTVFPTADDEASVASQDGAPVGKAKPKRSNVYGNLSFEISADILNASVQVSSSDPYELQNQYELFPNENDQETLFIDSNYCRHPFATENKVNKFRLLISELRGDIWNLSRKLTGDYPTKAILKDNNVLSAKRLPNFNNANTFLRRKFVVQDMIAKDHMKQIKERIKVLTDLLKAKNDVIQRQLVENRNKMKKAAEQVEDMKEDVQRYTKIVTDLRKPHPEPKEPIFPELPPVPYVPALPASGGLDSRGKKKKALPANDLKSILENLEVGKYDGVDLWPLPDNFFPSQAQALKINKGIELRNKLLDNKRES